MGFIDWWNGHTTAVKLFIVASLVGGILLVGIPVVGSFVLGIGGDPVRVPTFAVDSKYDSDARTVTLQHAGGDPVDSTNVAVEIGDDRLEQWPDEDGKIEKGDTATIENVRSGTEIRVVWSGEEERQVVAEVTAD